MADTAASAPNAVARAERRGLCDLLLEVGPDAPTLCTGWTTRDLAAHLVVRESRPDASLGIVLPPLSGWTHRVQSGAARLDYAELVDAETLARPDAVAGECRLLVAARFGAPRLLDNLAVPVMGS